MANSITVITTDRKLCREAIRTTLVHRAGGAPDASAVWEATTATWSEMAALLKPVIGARGVDAIFRRSLYLASITCPCLTLGVESADSAALLAGFKTRLAGREPDDAAEAACTLLVTFTELLTTLIGESLTERLLGPIWASPAPSSEQEIEL